MDIAHGQSGSIFVQKNLIFTNFAGRQKISNTANHGCGDLAHFADTLHFGFIFLFHCAQENGIFPRFADKFEIRHQLLQLHQ